MAARLNLHQVLKSKRREYPDTRQRRIDRKRRHHFEQLEPRQMLASGWHNLVRPGDVNQDGNVSAVDALQIINELNARVSSDGEGVLDERILETQPFYDVNDDGLASALDALRVINILALGNPPPSLDIGLASDTGLDGDLYTSSILVTGTATDINNPVGSISFDIGDGSPVAVVPNADGSFSFTPDIALDGSADGMIQIEATATDEDGAASDTVSLLVTLDTQAPITPSLVLDPAFDSAPLGDLMTDQTSVRLVGVTSPGSRVELPDLKAETTADATGGFAFDNVPLEVGDNEFTVAASDLAGNSSSGALTIIRGSASSDLVVQLDDTSDRTVRQNVSFAGQITGNAAIEALLVQTDLGDVVSIDTSGSFSFTTNFPLDGSADGQHVIRFRALDDQGNVSPVVTVPITLDTVQPTTSIDVPDLVRDNVQVIEINYSEPVLGGNLASSYTLSDGDGNVISIDGIEGPFGTAYTLNLSEPLADAEYQLTIDTSAITDPAGNSLDSGDFSFGVAAPTRLTDLSPRPGEELVSLTRETIIRFNDQVDPETVNSESFYLIANGERIAGNIRVSSTERFATFFYDAPLPPSTEVRVVVDGDRIAGRDGLSLDADGDGEPGGLLEYDFRTLPLSFIPGTSVFGFVFDSYNQDGEGNDIPIVGATISLDADPSVFAVTDENGFFELGLQDNNSDGRPDGLPAPDFFVHIDGSTAVNAPGGTSYATLGKPFHSIPGQRTQLEMDGEAFDIYLPPMAESDIVELNTDADTVVGLGAAGQAEVREMFADDPDKAQAIIDNLQITYPASSAQDADGTVATRAAVIPVDPNRLPAPLPPNMQPEFVFSVQAGTEVGFNLADGNLSFDIPAQVSFPNLEGAAPGEHAILMSFDHDAGIFKPTAVATVSEDGSTVTTDPGTGIEAPGWHFVIIGGTLALAGVVALAVFAAPITAPVALGAALGTAGAASLEFYMIVALGGVVGIATMGWLGSSDAPNDLECKTDLSCTFASGNIAGGQGEPLRVLSPETTERLYASLVEFSSVASVVVTPEFLQRYEIDRDSFSVERRSELKKAIATLESIELAEASALANEIGKILEAIEYTQTLFDVVGNGFGETWSEYFFGVADRVTAIEAMNATVAAAVSLSGVNGSPITDSELNQIKLDFPSIPANQIDQLAEHVATTFFRFRTGEIESDGSIDLDALIAQNDFFDQLEAKYPVNTLQQFYQQSASGYAESLESFLDVPSVSEPINFSYMISSDDSDFELVGRSDSSGVATDISIPSDESLRIDLVNPQQQLIANTAVPRLASGTRFTIPTAVLAPSIAGDTDGDGLRDDVERAIGTSVSVADTDEDGVNDYAEIQAGTDPLGGRAFPTGIIASLPIQGEASEVVVAASQDSGDPLAFVATGSDGLAIVDTSGFDLPIVLGQLDLSGDAQDVAVDALASMAIVATSDGGLQFVDVSDPMMPRVVRTASFNASQVELVDGIVFASTETQVRSFDPVSGELLETFLIPESTTIVELAHASNFIYAVDDSNVLHVLEATGLRIAKLGSVQLPDGGGGITVDRDTLYIGAQPSHTPGGFVTVDVSNPTNPSIISGTDVDRPFIAPGQVITPNGSGLGLAVGLAGASVDQPVVSIVDVSDPSVTDNYLTQFDLPAVPRDVEIASGIGYIADGAGGLVVVNYLGFDNQGNAPTVTIAGPDGDGIQEGSIVPIRVDVTDDVQVRDVELLLNGEVVARDISAPFDLRAVTPSLASGVTTVELQVRAFDTGGNAGVSEILSYDLTPDITPPTFIGSSPSDTGAGFRVRAVTLRFDEPIDETDLSPDDFTLLDLGDDFVLRGGDDFEVPISRVDVLSSRRLVLYTESPLAEGRFQLTADAGAVSDIAGNAISESIAVSFASFDFDEQNAVAWISDSDGNWNDPSNWSSGQVPGPNDTVILDRKTSNVTVNIDQGNIAIRSLIGRENLVMSGGTLTVTEPSEISSRLEITNGTLIADGNRAIFTATGDTEIDGASFTATSGGQILLPNARDYSGSANDSFTASGVGSLLSLPGLTSITNGTSSGFIDLRVLASAGGQIDLSGVTFITDPSSGDTRGRSIGVTAEGAGSLIDLSSLTSFTDANSDERSFLRART
ncbi:MAG: Ig-like domain-containing protein, partial [Planctomycetota bacterium]